MTTTVACAFDTTLRDRDICIEFQRTTKFSYENYGADADGNRGVMMLLLDDDFYSDVVVIYYDDDTATRIAPSALSNLDAMEVDRLIAEWMDAHELDPTEQDEPDYDSINDEARE